MDAFDHQHAAGLERGDDLGCVARQVLVHVHAEHQVPARLAVVELVDVSDLRVDLQAALGGFGLRLLDADFRNIEARDFPAERREEQGIAPLAHADVERLARSAPLYRFGEKLVELVLLALALGVEVVPDLLGGFLLVLRLQQAGDAQRDDQQESEHGIISAVG